MSEPNKPNPPRDAASPSPKPAAKRAFQSPKGTRDLYPEDAALRRFITEAWRNASIRHGFEEIDGPTFEDAELYKVKSGDGILAEMFGVFSGKSPEDVEAVRDPNRGPPYALRPEFTPTLARMYAARAAQLGKPTKWFTAGPFFRAERPQRGRLREFLQWNVDFIGLPSVAQDSGSKVAQNSVLSSGAARPDQPVAPKVGRLSEPVPLPPPTTPTAHDPLVDSKARADAECIACCIQVLALLGLTSDQVKVRISDRSVIRGLLAEMKGIDGREIDEARALAFLDQRNKLSLEQQESGSREIGMNLKFFDVCRDSAQSLVDARKEWSETEWTIGDGQRESVQFDYRPVLRLMQELDRLGVGEWCVPDFCIVRGLAYYTGMVFEVIADGERAVAGGGRYDNLIELFGGPPTPAVGFGMGDVVLTNLLRDKGLLPEGKTLLDKLSQTPASLRPDAFVLTADESLDPLVRQLVADLRRGSGGGGGMVAALSSHADSPESSVPEHGSAKPEPCRPLHARHSYKSTRNVGKLLKEAAAQHARYAVIIESETEAGIKPLDGGEQFSCPVAEVSIRLAQLERATHK